MPLLDKDSRAAMWVLVTIYQRAAGADREREGFDVFTERASVPTAGKLGILARGMGEGCLEPGVGMSAVHSDVIVVGAGAAGLAAAVALAARRREGDAAGAQAVCGRAGVLV